MASKARDIPVFASLLEITEPKRWAMLLRIHNHTLRKFNSESSGKSVSLNVTAAQFIDFIHEAAPNSHYAAAFTLIKLITFPELNHAAKEIFEYIASMNNLDMIEKVLLEAHSQRKIVNEFLSKYNFQSFNGYAKLAAMFVSIRGKLPKDELASLSQAEAREEIQKELNILTSDPDCHQIFKMMRT